MNDNITFLDIDEDDDQTVFQTNEDLKKIEQEISGLTDEDPTEVDSTQQITRPNRPYWQEVFG